MNSEGEIEEENQNDLTKLLTEESYEPSKKLHDKMGRFLCPQSNGEAHHDEEIELCEISDGEATTQTRISRPVTGIRIFQAIPKRFIILVMIALANFNMYCIRMCVNVTIVAMTHGEDDQHNTTESRLSRDEEPEFHWSTQLQGTILASLYWSYTALQIPAGLLCAKYGSSFLLGIAIFGSSVLTLFTPLIVRANVSAFIVLRVLEGAFLGLVASSSIDLISKWSPIYERSIFVTVSYAGLLWGTVFANSISGLLAGSSYGWPSVFYFFGAQGVLWYLCWLYLGVEQPADHPTISRSEIQKIGKHWTTKLKFREIPWRYMLTSIRVWAIILPVFMDCWCFYTFMFSFPSYLSDVHKLDITTIGFTSSIPYVVAGLLTPAWGFFIDMLRKRKYLSTTNARKLSYLFGAGIGGVFIFAMVYASNASTAIVIATIAITVSNFSSSGPGANLVELAPKYSSVLMGISNFACNITGFISPEVVGSLTEHGNIQQWAIVFYITAAIEVFGMLLYLVFGSSEKQPWADN